MAGNISLSFDGVDDYIDCGIQPELWSQSLSQFSFSFWINLSSIDLTNRTLINHGYNTPQSFLCHRDNGNGDIVWFRITNAAGNDVLAGIAVSPSILNRWAHITCVYDNSLPTDNIKIYGDGILGGTTANLTETLNLSTTLTLNGAVAGFQAGKIKDFRWWTTKALTQSEINKVNANTEDAPIPDYWLKMTENTGDPVDFISRTKTGIIHGSRWVYDAPSVWLTTQPYSFSTLSFSPISFHTSPIEVGSGGGKRNRWRTWVSSWARDLRNFFKIKQRPPEPEDVPIPTAQPPKIFHILPEPPTMETKLETLNDKWSVVASSPPPVAAQYAAKVSHETIYPLVLNPLTAPLIQKKVTLPRATRPAIIPIVQRGEGSHIESAILHFKKPKNRSKTASTINTLMILLEIERQV